MMQAHDPVVQDTAHAAQEAVGETLHQAADQIGSASWRGRV